MGPLGFDLHVANKQTIFLLIGFVITEDCCSVFLFGKCILSWTDAKKKKE
jgi:hypothetical protein